MYGFCLDKNKYNSLKFNLVLKSGAKRVVTLKLNKLSDGLLAYVRLTMVEKFKSDTILVSTPVDYVFEMFVLNSMVKVLE